MAGMMSRNLALKVVFLSVIVLVNAAGECYFPNGDLARRDTPCYTDGGISHCCGPNSLCLTNGLCLAVVAPFTLSRGSCTDKTWGPSCPSICDRLQTSSGAVLAHYKGSTSDSTYCCGSVAIKNGSLVCGTINNQTQQPFSIDNGTFMAGVATLANYIETSNSNSTASGQTGRTASNNSSKVTAVGAGVGAPLGVIAIAASVWAVVERRKRKRMAPAPATPVFSDSRTSNGAELYGYSQKSAKRLNGGSDEVHRSY